MLPLFKATPHIGSDRPITTANTHRREENLITDCPSQPGLALYFSYLDQFVSKWTDRENTSREILSVFPPDRLQQMLLSGLSLVQEFAIIMLRTAVCGSVPTELQPVLRYLFTEFFHTCPFAPRLLATKVFLEVLLTADEAEICELLSFGLPNVGYVREHLTFDEECHFAVALAMIDERPPSDEDSVERDPPLHDLSVTVAEMNDPEAETPPCEIPAKPVFFALDQFACRWQQREDVAPLIEAAVHL
jgi:hypothetical protein